jgi:hypothetical protein
MSAYSGRRQSQAPLNALADLSIFAQKPALDFGVDIVQPLLRAISLLLIGRDLSFKIADALFRCTKLLRKPLRGLDGVPAILFGKVSSLVDKLQDRLTSGIKLAAVVLSRGRSRELNYLGSHCLKPFRSANTIIN